MDIRLGLTAVASGTDTITATYDPAPTLFDRLTLLFRAAGANATTTPTFNPNALGAKTIVKKGGSALIAGDIAGAGFVALVQYDLANTRWELLNPAVSGGTPAGSDTEIQLNDSGAFGASADLAFKDTGLGLGVGLALGEDNHFIIGNPIEGSGEYLLLEKSGGEWFFSTHSAINLATPDAGDNSTKVATTAYVDRILRVLSKNVDYVAVPNNLVVYDTNGADRTLTLPVDPFANARVGIYLQTQSSNFKVIIDRNGKTIGGAAANVNLYIVGDYIELRYDGISDWIIVSNSIQKHQCILSRVAAQTIGTSSHTKILFDTEDFDNASIGDLANSRIVIREAGRYHIHASSSNSLANGQRTILSIYLNGVALRQSIYASSGSFTVAGPVQITEDFAAGDIIEFYQWQNTGGNTSTDTSVQLMPRISIIKI